mgnify:CR=1 FL=1
MRRRKIDNRITGRQANNVLTWADNILKSLVIQSTDLDFDEVKFKQED